MHNKELLLGVGRRDAPYTHIIHVWTQNGDIGFTYDSYGSITPEDLTGILIGAVRTHTRLALLHFGYRSVVPPL